MKFSAKLIVLTSVLSSFSLSSTSLPAFSQTMVSQGKRSDVWAMNTLNHMINKYQIKLIDNKDKTISKVTDSYRLVANLHQILQQKPLAEFTNLERFSLNKISSAYQKEFDAYLESLEDDISANQLEIKNNHVKLKQLNSDFSFKPFGVFAIRFCGMASNIISQPQKIGQRIEGALFQPRFGGGIRGHFADDFSFGLRALSQPTDNFNTSWYPVGNVDVGRAPISLDRYFIRYRPFKHMSSGFNMNLTVGKALNFFPETELLFDEDVSFSGLSQHIELKDLTPFWKRFSFGLAENILLSEGTFIKTGLLGAKVSSVFRPLEALSVKVGGSYIHYLGTNSLVKHNFFQGYIGKLSTRNRTFGENQFTSGFNLANSFLKLKTNISNIPLELFGDVVHNFGSLDKNTGYLIGSTIGHLKKTGDVSFSYNYKVLPQDYNLSLVVQDQMGGTNVAGHEFNLGVKLAKKTNFNLILQTRSSLTEADSDNLYILYTVLSQRF